MNQMGSLEKLGILVIVILVVVVGVVAITPKSQVEQALFPTDEMPVEPLEPEAGPDTAWPINAASDVGPAAPLGATSPGTLPATPPGTAPADMTQPPALPPVPQFSEYVVVKGDNGERIAKKTSMSWAEISAMNGGVDARKLQIGQKLRVTSASAAAPAPSGSMPTTVAPAPAPAPTPAAPAATGGEIYAVRSGDTLYDIARRELGSASKWRAILEANQDVLKGSETVRAGMKLRLPGRTSGTTTVAAVPPATSASKGARTYKVQSGDTLMSIATRTLGSQSRWRELLRANEAVLHGSDRLMVGMELTIPQDVSAR